MPHINTRIAEPLKHMRRHGSLKASNDIPVPSSHATESRYSHQRTRGGNDLARVPGHGHVDPDFFETRESDDCLQQWPRMAEAAVCKVPLAVATRVRVSTRGEVIASPRIPKRECEDTGSPAWSCTSGSCRRVIGVLRAGIIQRPVLAPESPRRSCLND